MAHDWLFARRLAAGRIETDSGRRHSTLDLDASLGYVEEVYRDYCGYAGVEGFSGTVGELGPGDNFGVALLALHGGAREVHTIDRYYSRRDPEQQHAIYRALAQRHDLGDRFRDGYDEDSIRGLSYHAGEPAEVFFRQSGIRFDAILSRAVMEHLYDPLGALDDMLEALEPAGVMVHRIDLRDHGMFEGRHPLTFLRVPEPLYRRMTRNSGRPNRVLFADYRRWLEKSGAEGSLRVSHLVGDEQELEPCALERVERRALAAAVDRVRDQRPRFASRFEAENDEELAVSGLVLIVRKD
jgi:SAM-dependent methyltransferase